MDSSTLPFSDADTLTAGLELLSAPHPDLVVSSAFGQAGATTLRRHLRQRGHTAAAAVRPRIPDIHTTGEPALSARPAR